MKVTGGEYMLHVSLTLDEWNLIREALTELATRSTGLDGPEADKLNEAMGEVVTR